MNPELPFDEFAKKQLSNFEPEVPGRIWENILAANKKRRPKGFWFTLFSGRNFLFTSVILVLLSIGIYKIAEPDKTAKVLPLSKNADSGSGKEGEQDRLETGNLPGKSGLIREMVASTVAEKEVKEQIIAVTSLGETPNQGNKLFSMVQDNRQQRKNHSTSKENYSRAVNEPGSVQDTDDDLYPATVEQLFTVNRKMSPSLDQRADFQVAMRNLRDIDINTQITKAPKLKLPDCPAIEKDAAGNKEYFEIYAGPDYAFSNYKTLGDSSSFNYAKKRKETTTFISAYSAGARFTKVFNNAMSIRAGLNYSQVNEKFRYINPAELRFITVITTRVIIRAPGDTIYINDTLRYQQSGTRVKTTYNKYRSIDIPLMLGYEIGNGKLHANISAGAIINLYSWYKGDVLDTLYQPVSITTGKNSSAFQYKTNIGVGFITSASVYYKLNDKWHLLFEPYFRYNLSPMSKENLNLQQKSHTAGLRAGVRFDLGQRK